jgi:hypothetical protein
MSEANCESSCSVLHYFVNSTASFINYVMLQIENARFVIQNGLIVLELITDISISHKTDATDCRDAAKQ